MKLLLLLLLPLTACASVDDGLTYKTSIKINKYLGYAVVPYAKSYSFKIQAGGPLDYLQWTTCHRKRKQYKAGDGILKKNVTTLNYRPTAVEEDCFIELDTLTKKGRHYHGAIFFKNPAKYKLGATLHCDGKVQNFSGVSACEAAEGLTQRIVFKEEVKMASACITGTLKARSFDLKPIIRDNPYCTYVFRTKDNRRHKLYVRAYQRM